VSLGVLSTVIAVSLAAVISGCAKEPKYNAAKIDRDAYATQLGFHERMARLGLALILAVTFIYIVLASQFESFVEPFLIMLSLPLAIVGAIEVLAGLALLRLGTDWHGAGHFLGGMHTTVQVG